MYQQNEHNYYNSENDGYRPEPMGFDSRFDNPKPHKGSGRQIIALLLCCTLVGGGAGVGGAAVYTNYFAPQPPAVTTQLNVTSTQPATTISSASGNALSAEALYSQNVASCVGVTISGAVTNVYGQASTMAASGSGFVLTTDGYVVTNCHVIADAIDNPDIAIQVTFHDGTSYPATLMGYEADNDIAVLKIEATGLQPVTLGDSDTLAVGELVYAIGNPLGELDFTLTDGLVSAMDRLVTTEEGSTMNMLQTNTAINPGNSGGPLFNEAGQVIGITTAKYSSSSSGATVEGLGFAIPINDVLDMIQDLMDYGYVTGKPYMGVQINNVSAEAQWYGVAAGAAVSYIAEGGAAEKAGLQVGDIVTAIDDTAVDSSSALTAAITAYKAGDSAQLTVVRQSETITLTIVFDEKNSETESANQLPEQPQQKQPTVQIPSGGFQQFPFFW